MRTEGSGAAGELLGRAVAAGTGTGLLRRGTNALVYSVCTVVSNVCERMIGCWRSRLGLNVKVRVKVRVSVK